MRSRSSSFSLACGVKFTVTRNDDFDETHSSVTSFSSAIGVDSSSLPSVDASSSSAISDVMLLRSDDTLSGCGVR